ncbi:MAG: magnesium transporter [Clostridia bacterium]|nr:magnesium transporter [Clostridia bacterium]
MKEIILGLLDERAYDKLKSVQREIAPQDLAELLQELREDGRKSDVLTLFRLLPKQAAAEVFVEMDAELQEALIRDYSDGELRSILNELYLDDTVDLIEEMPANVVRRILKVTDAKTRAQINEILNYADDSAGSIMTVEYVALNGDMTVSEAFARIRRTGVDKETIYTCYVIDAGRRLVGTVSARTLLLADEFETIADLMTPHPFSVTTDTDREIAVNLFEKYDLLALPVVDREERLVGIVTVDDAMDVLLEETTEDIQKMAAIIPTEKPYLKIGVLETWRHRIPWLLIMMLSATFTQIIISGFEAKLQSVVILTAFIPMLMGTGGNCGSQSSVSVIRSLSLDEIRLRDVGKILWKETRVAIVSGATLAVVSFLKVLLLDRWLLGSAEIDAAVSLTVALSLAVTVVIAKTVGCILPLLAKRLGLDPAVMAAPFITTIVDGLALLAYFCMASLLLASRFSTAV